MEPDLPSYLAQYVGIPYRTHGRARDGADCWGLIQMVLNEQLGSPWPDYEGEDWFDGQSAAALGADASAYADRQGFVAVERGSEQLGDGILLRLRGHPIHAGLVVAPGWMLHTLEETGSAIESFERLLWRNRIIGIYRYVTAG